jgi:phosphoglycolate phosphatase-like HAD superfamily hydrolase
LGEVVAGGDVVLCWDIDGTLLTTARAGIGAWEQALQDVLGRCLDLESLPTAGLTDVQIGSLLTDRLGAPAAVLGTLVSRYESLLPKRLHDRQGRIMPGVREFLEWNRREGWACCILLTGNTRLGATAKLAHYGLAEFFEYGAFASLDDPDRVAVARKAVALVSGVLGSTVERMVVIGDTPHDIDGARAVGARTIAVATGPYSTGVLESAGAWRVVPAIPAPLEMVRLVSELVSCDAAG